MSRTGSGSTRIEWPGGKRFAFSVFDDSDLATVENVGPVYTFLEELGFRTTKSVWPMHGTEIPVIGGQTCDDADYRAWVLDLQRRGFEIGSHGATPATSEREVVIAATDRFRELFGHDPQAFANHSGCRESIYWGSARVSGIHRLAYNLVTGFRRTTFSGSPRGRRPLLGRRLPASGSSTSATSRTETSTRSPPVP